MILSRAEFALLLASAIIVSNRRLRLEPGQGANLASARNSGIMVNMVGQQTLQPKKRGPKPTGQGTPVQVRLQPDQLAALDRWREAQSPAPTRPEAVRQLIEIGMGSATDADD